jgi:hypothetical protein
LRSGARARCHSCVDGLRARLKPERFWFDSRGRHDCGSLMSMQHTGLLNREVRVQVPGDPPTISRCHLMARDAVWDRVMRVRLPPPRRITWAPERPAGNCAQPANDDAWLHAETTRELSRVRPTSEAWGCQLQQTDAISVIRSIAPVAQRQCSAFVKRRLSVRFRSGARRFDDACVAQPAVALVL